MPVLVVPVLLSALSLALCGAALVTGLSMMRLRRDRSVWRAEKERFADEIWELRAAAAARDKAEAASEAKSRFLATLSHEFRTPLNGIIGMADLLRGTPLTGEQQAYVDAVRSSGRALADMIDEILDFSRIEAGRLDLVEEPVDLASLVEGIVELLAPRAQEKGLDIAALIEPTVPARVLGDGARLRQVLLNLAGNAVKFTDGGGVGIRVGREGDHIHIAVLDTGPGVPLERQAAIFTEFEQADNSTTRRHGGTGLGLAISSRIVSRMGGNLRYNPREEGGSRFSFAVALAALESEADSAVTAAIPDWHELSALVVSAAPFTAAFLAESLEAAGLRVDCCETVDAAMSHLRCAAEVPGFLLIDPASAEGDSQRLLAEARRRHIPRVITLVAPRDRQGRIDAGLGEAWLIKPIRKRSLLAQLGTPESVSASDASVPEHPPLSRERHHVLLAEDNPINALIVQRSLERLGARVVHVPDGVAALEHLRSSLMGNGSIYDLVLMDVSMPGLDGLEVTRRVRALESAQRRPPVRIVALTAHALEDSHHACRQAGMDDVLTKPVLPASLAGLLEQASYPLKATG